MATTARKKPAKKAASKKPAGKAARKPASADLHAKGGGDAPAAGVTHQGWVGGLFAAIGLDQAPVDKRLQLAAESISEVKLETDSPIDDLILLTTARVLLAPFQLFGPRSFRISRTRLHAGPIDAARFEGSYL
jgi:hypothetical protein